MGAPEAVSEGANRSVTSVENRANQIKDGLISVEQRTLERITDSREKVASRMSNIAHSAAERINETKAQALVTVDDYARRGAVLGLKPAVGVEIAIQNACKAPALIKDIQARRTQRIRYRHVEVDFHSFSNRDELNARIDYLKSKHATEMDYLFMVGKNAFDRAHEMRREASEIRNRANNEKRWVRNAIDRLRQRPNETNAV